MSSSQLRWGIVGCGIISGVFARDLVYLNRNPRGANKIKHVITRVASRSPAKGQEFIEKNIDEYYDGVYGTKVVSYEDIQIDPEVDILYIGLPHTLHHSFVIEAITRGKKHILCEKPVTVNSKQLELILDAARENNVFFMEAVWVRYFPLIREVQKILYEDKKVGNVKRIFSDLSVDMKRLHGDDWVPSNRVADKKLGGGALLDITIYPITYSRIFMDPQSDPKSNWKIISSMVFESLNGKQEDEVDFCTSFIISDQTHKQQATGISSFSSDVSDGLIAKIDGELGSISIYSGGIGPAPIKYHIKFKNGQEIEKSFEDDLDGTLGYIYEAIECGEMIVAGEKQSSIMSWNESQLIMSILDDIRKQNSLSYEVDL